jgi:hypothetical protein
VPKSDPTRRAGTFDLRAWNARQASFVSGQSGQNLLASQLSPDKVPKVQRAHHIAINSGIFYCIFNCVNSQVHQRTLRVTAKPS